MRNIFKSNVGKSVLAIIVIVLSFLGYNKAMDSYRKANNIFRFEDYDTKESAKQALLGIHPIGDPANSLVNTLEAAGMTCKEMDKDKLKKAQLKKESIRHLTGVIHCGEVGTGFMGWLVWTVSVMKVSNKIDNIGIHKEYRGM